MTQPSEESIPSEAAIRAALVEAGVRSHAVTGWVNYLQSPGEDCSLAGRALRALARRIDAEREAVPVAWRYERDEQSAIERHEDKEPT